MMIEDDDFDDDEAEIYTHFVFKVKLVRMIDDMLFPSNLKFKIEIIPLETGNINKIFNKIRYWLDNIVNNSIAFANDDANAIEMFINQNESKPRVSNTIILTPEEPNDQHLAAIFQAKLQALAGESLIFGSVEVQSDNQLGLEFTFVGDATSLLPSMEEWVGERSYFSEPWWNRDDGSSLDVVPTADADLSKKPNFAFDFDFLDRKTTFNDATIVRPEFKPTIIDGGKT